MEVPLKNITNFLSYLNPFDDNFILKGVLDFLGNILSYINPFSDNFILKGVLDFLGNILSYINPFSDNFLGKKIVSLIGDLLQFLFVPDENPFNNLGTKFSEKFAFIYQIKDLVLRFLGFTDYGSNAPDFSISWNGVEVSIIDFSLFLDYRIWLHGIILVIAWIVFLFRLYKRLPSIIGGFSQ